MSELTNKRGPSWLILTNAVERPNGEVSQIVFQIEKIVAFGSYSKGSWIYTSGAREEEPWLVKQTVEDILGGLTEAKRLDEEAY